jgi:hypothetical protein
MTTIKATKQDDVWTPEVTVTITIVGDTKSIRSITDDLKREGWNLTPTPPKDNQ